MSVPLHWLHRVLAGLTARDAITTALDIAIVYYLIYRALLLIKGTRAAQMLIGLLLIGGAFMLAKQLELATVSWLLDNFVSYGILLVIVIFQHDIRRGLMRVGRNLFAPARLYQESHVFEEIIQAAMQLGQKKIGALIVLERDADLSEFIEAGIEIDAQVSRELLVSLFVPSSENVLHDGAVLVKNLRIVQAGTVLPLSANPKLDKALGTRHRAAIGITEETDAVSIAVSEERGTVSLCFHGNIARELDAQTLRKALLGLFYREKRRRRARAAASGKPVPGQPEPAPGAPAGPQPEPKVTEVIDGRIESR
ncbi:MAG TPA: diadenylate cyclase CdaA [Polyangia bacterium]|nr:diadenylate cyclase CdaA [Polyangia bacterium]